jgi:predicted AAA+ superfamily ATPase
MDLGLRNFVLNNFNPLALRNDQGNLFENFFLLELLKDDHYSLNKINFWRTTNQTEIDFIVSGEDKTEAIEVKWDKESIPKGFETLKKYYPEIQTRVVIKTNS